MTLRDLASHAKTALVRAGITPQTAALDAELLARHLLNWDRASWVGRNTEPAPPQFQEQYGALVGRRERREPVAYIRGVQEFWGRTFRVTPAVLIPRPESELVIESAQSYLTAHPQAVVADVGTGSGCLAITIALGHPQTSVWATDISEPALAVARANAEALGAVVRFARGAYLAELPRPLDLIVSNPPYVREIDRQGLSSEVKDYEPATALFGGPDGLRDIRALVREAELALAPGGQLVMEVGYGQSEPVAEEVHQREGLALQTIRADLQGIPRVVIAERRRD